jgi:VWFA-related protein
VVTATAVGQAGGGDRVFQNELHYSQQPSAIDPGKGLTVRSQTVPKTGDQLQTIIRQINRPAFPTVTVFGSIRTADGTPISDLSANTVTITENGNEQPIESIEPIETDGGTNISTSLVIDASGSMADPSASDQTTKIANAKVAANEFVSQLDADDEGQIIAFNTTSSIKQRWTTASNDLRTGIDAIETDGGTALWAATTTAVTEAESRRGRSAVIVLTDGKNNEPPADVDAAIAATQATGVPVYVIGLGQETNEPALRRLAAESGGSYYYSPNSSALAGIYAQIEDTIAMEYKITYRTRNTATDGTNRRVRLTANAGGQSGTGTGMYRAPCAPLPTARFESTPSTPTPGQQITFDASPSNANGGTIAGYRWDFDNDGRVDATGETVTHTYSNEGEYRARLTVEKRCGVTNVTVNQVSVSSDASDITGINNSFVVESTTRGADFNYTFRVDGRVERVGATDFEHGGEREAEDADRIVENNDGTVTVRGFTGNLYGDAYVITGEVLSFERTGGESGYRLEFNGTDVTRELTGSSAETMDQPITGDNAAVVVESTTRGADFNYTFTVAGTVERVEPDDFDLGGERAAEEGDQIIENSDGTVTVRGFTGNLYGDAFVIDGELRSFQRTGGTSGYRVEVNGADVTEAVPALERLSMIKPLPQ